MKLIWTVGEGKQQNTTHKDEPFEIKQETINQNPEVMTNNPVHHPKLILSSLLHYNVAKTLNLLLTNLICYINRCDSRKPKKTLKVWRGINDTSCWMTAVISV